MANIKIPYVPTSKPFDEGFAKRLEHYLKQGMESQMREIAKELEKTIKKNLYYPNNFLRKKNARGSLRGGVRHIERYERTHQFGNAVSYELKPTTDISGRKGYETRVFIDTDKVDATIPSNGYGWGQHMGYQKTGGFRAMGYVTHYNGYHIKEWLVDWIENGQKSSAFSYEGIKAFEKVNKWLQKELVRNSLIKKEIEVGMRVNVETGDTSLISHVLKGGKPRIK